MGKDFRVGLITGVVLAGAALIWVATRPSLSLRAGLPQASRASEGTGPAFQAPLAWETVGDAETSKPQVVAQDQLQNADNVQPTVNDAPAASAPSAPADAGPASVAAGSTPTPASVAAQGDLTVYETSEPIKTTRFHIVRKGENLSTISQQYLGSSSKWRQIVAANAKTIKDPNKIAPGTKLIIPD